MSERERREPVQPVPPAGPAGDGMDRYPTYHDQPGDSLARAPGRRPTDTNLPQSRRTSPGPMLMGVLAFAAVVAVFLVWSLINMAVSVDDAATPGTGAAAPVEGAPAVSGTAIDVGEPPGTGEPGLDTDVQPQREAPAPEAVSPRPGAIDVPGGAPGSTPPATNQ
jgi:hypothetical protein